MGKHQFYRARSKAARVSSYLKKLREVPRLFPLMALAAFTLVALEAAARSGGGKNYRGGGGSFGGGGGGGGGDGIGFLIYLVFAYPQIGVPLAVAVIAVAAVRHYFNPDRTTSRAVKRLEDIPFHPNTDLSRITARDPRFDPTAFLKRVRALELKVQDAWCDGDMSPVRPFLSDGLFRRFETQLHIMKAQSIRNVMADHHIIDARIHAVDHDEDFDTLHVAIHASARDVEVDAALSDEKALGKAESAKAERYVEIWSFMRRPGAATRSDEALGGRCPSCGADLPDGQAVRCDHCSALVNSGRYDWVLAEITQAEEWRAASSGRVPGLDALRAADPGFNRQAAEDRASYLFWRWMETLVKGDPTPLAKVATKPFKERMKMATRSGPGNYYKTAVGAVDLVGCEVDVDGKDRYHVKLLWSSARSRKTEPVHHANILTVSRKHGAVTEDGEGFSYAHCPECHGPLTENDTPTCDFCDANLEAGDKAWVLEAVIQPEELRLRSATSDDPAENTWLPDMADRRERTLLLMRMAAVVMADGVVTKAESKLLKTAAKRWQIPYEAVTPILSGEVDLEMVTTLKPADPTAFFRGLVAAALVDGRIDGKERRLLIDVARNLELPMEQAAALMEKR